MIGEVINYFSGENFLFSENSKIPGISAGNDSEIIQVSKLD